MEVLTPAKRDSLKSTLPNWVEPCLASNSTTPFSDPDWLFERAYDGIPCIIYKQTSHVRILSQAKKDLTSSFPEIAQKLASQKGNFIVDGEIVAFDGDVTSFPKLQQRLQEPAPTDSLVKDVPVFLYIFDMMHGGDYDITDVKLLTRKDILHTLIDFEGPIRFCDHQHEQGEWYYNQAIRKGWDGIIAKKMNSTYEGGYTENWLRIRC